MIKCHESSGFYRGKEVYKVVYVVNIENRKKK